jgi:Lamin Tail Domain
VDLRGWKLRSEHDPGFTIPRSLIVPAGGTVILGRSGDSLTNGGVHVDLVYTGISLGNSGDWLVLRDTAGATSDSVEWSVQQPGVALDHRAEHTKRSIPPRVTPPRQR